MSDVSAASFDPKLKAGCSILLHAKDLELNYYRAGTVEERVLAREELFEWVRKNQLEPAGTVSTEGFSGALYRAALGRKVGPIPFPAQMESKELASLFFSGDPTSRLRSLESAYRVSEFRLGASLFFQSASERVLLSLKRSGKWVSRETYDILPNSLRAKAENLLVKTRNSTPGKIVTRIVSAPFRLSNWLLQTLPKVSPYLAIAPRVSNAERARTITLYAALKVRSLLLAGVDFVSPLHLRTFVNEKWIERTLPVFSKLEKNPKFLPVGEDLNILRRYGAEDAFARRQAMLLAHPNYFKATRLGDAAFRWTVAGFVAGSVGMAVYQATDSGGPISLEEYLKDPKHKLLPNQVQLISETLPFPHLAIRIGDRVYSYGTTHMSATPIEEYMRQHQANGDKSGFFDRQRSLQVVTLNLAPEETARMRKALEIEDGKAYDSESIRSATSPEYTKLDRYLSLQEKKEYKNITLVNDCASMVARALKKTTSISIPKGIDPSPASIIAYFTYEKALGIDKRVESVQLVLGDKNQNPALQLLRNAYINTREARLYFSPLGFTVSQGTRTAIDQTNTSQDIQHFDQEFLDREKSRRDDIELGLKDDTYLRYFFANKETLSADPLQREKVESYFQGVYEREFDYVEGGYSDLETLLGSLYRLEYYSQAEAEVLGTRSFDLKQALGDPQFYGEIQELMESLSPAK